MARKEILEIDPKEVILHDIRRHPIGLLSIFAVTGVLFVLFLGLVFFLITNAEQFGLEEADGFVTLMATGIGSLIFIGGYIAAYVYRQNEMVITNENIILINQISLFNRKISQLNLAKIQDVTGHQDTFLESTFGYGTLSIETAGEADNFIFPYSPNPHIHAKHIIEAHEQFIKNHLNNNVIQAPYNPL